MVVTYYIDENDIKHMNKNKNINAFKIYIDKYDSTDTKIALKIEHTYHVAENALVIAEDLGLPGEDVDLAWFLGLLHDIGRPRRAARSRARTGRNKSDHRRAGQFQCRSDAGLDI